MVKFKKSFPRYHKNLPEVSIIKHFFTIWIERPIISFAGIILISRYLKKFCLILILHQDKQKSKCQCRKFFHFKIFNSTKIPNDEPITTVFMAEIAALKTKEIRIGLLAQILA